MYISHRGCCNIAPHLMCAICLRSMILAKPDTLDAKLYPTNYWGFPTLSCVEVFHNSLLMHHSVWFGWRRATGLLQLRFSLQLQLFFGIVVSVFHYRCCWHECVFISGTVLFTQLILMSSHEPRPTSAGLAASSNGELQFRGSNHRSH